MHASYGSAHEYIYPVPLLKAPGPHWLPPVLPGSSCPALLCLQAFLPYYYGLFSTNRAGLGSLYQAASVLTFEGQKFVGPESIGQKLVGLPFQNVQVKPSTTDVQRSTSNGILIFVTGQLMVRRTCQLAFRTRDDDLLAETVRCVLCPCIVA